MKTWVHKTLSVGVLAAAALLFGPSGAAHADVWQGNGDNNGILNGTQLYAPISLPTNFCGNSLGLLGPANSFAGCSNDAFDDDFFDVGRGPRHGLHGDHGIKHHRHHRKDQHQRARRSQKRGRGRHAQAQTHPGQV